MKNEKEHSLFTWILKAKDQLLSHYDNNPDVTLRKIILLVDHVINEKNYFNFHKILIDEDQLKKLNFHLEEIIKYHKPIEYIIGISYFLNCHINIEPPILIPRVETEYWCEIIVNKLKEKKIDNFNFLDIGSGSGCISIGILKEFENSQGIALDILQNAVELTKKNAVENLVNNRLEVIKSDLFENLKKDLKFDIIFSNPPYIPDEIILENSVFLWEDKGALFAGKDGLFYIKKILETAYEYLKYESLLIIECDSLNIYEAIDFAYKLKKYEMIKLLYDQNNQPRVIILSPSKESFLNIEEKYL